MKCVFFYITLHRFSATFERRLEEIQIMPRAIIGIFAARVKYTEYHC